MKVYNDSLAKPEPSDFLTSADYEILKGILVSQQVLDLQYLSTILQKDLRYLSEILLKMKIGSFNIKKHVQKGTQKHFHDRLWPILAIISMIAGAGLYFLGVLFIIGGLLFWGYFLLITCLGLILIPYLAYYPKRSRGKIRQKSVVQYITAFKSRQEIDAFITYLKDLERTKRVEIEQQHPRQKRYYLSFQVTALLGLIDGILFILFGVWFGYRQIITGGLPTTFALWAPGVALVIIPCYYYSYFRGDGIIKNAWDLEKHFQESLPVYHSLLNIMLSEGNVTTLDSLEARHMTGNLKEILATFSSEGQRKLQWWRQRPVMNGLLNAYSTQFPPEIIHYIPSLALLVKPIKGEIPAQLEDWQMDCLRGLMSLERRVEITRFLQLAEIPRRSFMGALYKIIASGTIDVDLKGDIIELRDENQLNQMISQLQLAFQGWTA